MLQCIVLLDSTAYIPYRESLKPEVRQDLRDLKAFIENIRIRWNHYIHMIVWPLPESKPSAQGIHSYDEVVGLAIAYYKKYGKRLFKSALS